jgi:hypothetical protein
VIRNLRYPSTAIDGVYLQLQTFAEKLATVDLTIRNRTYRIEGRRVRIIPRFIGKNWPTLAMLAVSCGVFPNFACAQETAVKPRTRSGIIVSSACNPDEAFNESPECFKNVPGAKLALYDDTNRVMYGLEPQQKISAHLGDTVTVKGTLDEDVIQLTSIGPLAIGLSVGDKAPDFSAIDQFGKTQTLETLRSRNGTVLLFFRSADW